MEVQVKASLCYVRLSTNIYCDKLLKIFLKASVDHWKRCSGPLLACGPLFAHPWCSASVPLHHICIAYCRFSCLH